MMANSWRKKIINLSKSSVVTSIFILNVVPSMISTRSSQSFEVTVIDIFIDYIDYTCIRDGKDYEYETYVIIIEQNV